MGKNNEGGRMDKVKQDFNAVINTVEKRMKELEEKESHWAMLEASMDEHIAKVAEKVTLDVGGQKFATTKTTLLKQKGSFFDAMLSSGKWKPDDDGSYFIDRNPELFPVILDYLRTGKVNLKRYAYDVVEDLKTELGFYQVDIPELTSPMAGTKLLNKEQQEKIQEWVGKAKKFTLLFCATRDGFGVNNFHQKCDNKGPTVTVIQSTTGHIFGGYAADSWDSSTNYKNIVGCFIFTITNPHNILPTKYNYSNNGNSLYCNAGYGPTFGGHDLYVSTNANTVTNSASSFPHSYFDTTGHGNNTFTGSKNFTVKDYEVFQVY